MGSKIMAANQLNRYIWIVDTIRRHGRISRQQLDELWSRSTFGEGQHGIPRRTFFNYRKAIEELFQITILCDPATYEYYIEEHADDHDLTEWMLNASAINDVLQNSRDVSARILLENVPSAREFLAPIIDALRENHSIRFDYHPYTRSQPNRNVVVEPYFLRIHRQLWYITGRSVADNKVKTYSLDRIRNLTVNVDSFTPPPDCDPTVYFRDAFGITVNQSEPKTVKLRVDARQAKYFRALPLHQSQKEEMVCDTFSIFTYRMLITPDLVNELLSHGPRVTVLAPAELRTMVVSELTHALEAYKY